MKVPSIPDSTSKLDLSYFNQQWSVLANILNGGLSLGSATDPGSTNLQTAWFSGVTPGVPGTDFVVPHTLGVVPSGWVLVSIDQPAIVYKGAVQWTNKQISLRCNTGNVNVVLLIL